MADARGPSLPVAFGLVVGALSVGAFGILFVGGSSSEAVAATGFAFGVALISAIGALLISWRTLGTANALAGTLASGGVRVGVPLAVMLAATQSDVFADWFRTTESRFVERLGGLYLIGLAVETGCVYLKASQFNVVKSTPQANTSPATTESQN